jgi:hypothetical protein
VAFFFEVEANNANPMGPLFGLADGREVYTFGPGEIRNFLLFQKKIEVSSFVFFMYHPILLAKLYALP